MTGQNRLFSLVAILTVVSMAVVGVALAILYDSAFEQQRARLVDAVKSQASLIKAVAKYDQNATHQLRDENPEYDCRRQHSANCERHLITLKVLERRARAEMKRRCNNIHKKSVTS